VTSDWHGSLVSVVKELHPDIPHQRCLVHTQRRCEQLLTKNPQTEAGVRLLSIVKELNQIKTYQESRVWITWLKRWEEEYRCLVRERTYGKTKKGKDTWWYTHKNLRATYRTLITTLDNIFLYLDDPKLDKDTNGIESEFSHLKQKTNMHRGLINERKIAVIFWYLKFKNEERY